MSNTRRRVLITRGAARAAELIAALNAEGIAAIAEPVTMIERIAHPASLPELSSLDWLAFTSVNAVEIFVQILAESGGVLPADVRLAVVGTGTAKAVQRSLRLPDLASDGSGGGELAERLLKEGRVDARLSVLWPCGRDAQPDFANHLRASGVEVIEWPIYATRNIPPWLLHLRLEHLSSFSVVVFAAPSAVRSLKEAWPGTWTFRAVAIGETTARELYRFAIADCVVSRSPRPPDLVAAIRQALENRGRQEVPHIPKPRAEP